MLWFCYSCSLNSYKNHDKKMFTENTNTYLPMHSWYLIDTIPTNKITLVRDSVNIYYAFTDTVNEVDILHTNNILSMPNSYIVLTYFFRMQGNHDKLDSNNLFLQQAFATRTGSDSYRLSCSEKIGTYRGLDIIKIKERPSYYIYFLVKGKEIIGFTVAELLYVPSGLICNKEAYYRVLVPVWYPEVY